MQHTIKAWTKYYEAIASGEKNFELRINDRNYSVGDTLEIQEWNVETGFTGKTVTRHITYILEGGKFGLAEGYVIMSLV